jgi:hypothetical protein
MDIVYQPESVTVIMSITSLNNLHSDKYLPTYVRDAHRNVYKFSCEVSVIFIQF